MAVYVMRLSDWFPEDHERCYIQQLFSSTTDKMSNSQRD